MDRFVVRTVIIAVLASLLPALTWAQSEKQGIKIFNQARELYDKARSPQDLAKPLAKYQEAFKIFEKIRSEKWKGVTLNNLGEVHRALGKYPEALKYYEKSLAVSKKLGDAKGRGVTINNMALIYTQMGQYQRALEYYESAIEEARKTRDENIEAGVLVNMAEVYGSLGKYKQALELVEKSFQVARKLGATETQFQALFRMASLYESMGQYEKALDHFEQAAKVSGNSKLTNYRIGLLCLTMGDIPKAESFLKDSRGRIEVFAAARIELAKLNFEKAVQHLRMHLAASRQSRRVEGIFAGYTSLGLANEGLEQYDLAAQNYREAIRITEQIRDGLSESRRVNFYDAIIDHISRLSPYEGLCRVLFKSGKLAESFKQAESTKARIFSESLSKRAGRTDSVVPANIRNRDFAINNRIAALTQEVQKTYHKSAHGILSFDEAKHYQGAEKEAELLEKQLNELKSARDRHISSLRRQYPLFAATKYPQPMALEESALKDNEWVLEYEVTDPGVVIFLIKGKRIVKSLFKTVERKELDALVKKFRETLDLERERLLAFNFAAAKKLSDLLLFDILNELPEGAPLFVVPDDSLGALPFEALALNEGGKVEPSGQLVRTKGAEFFGDRNPISYQYSVTALTLARNLGKQDKPGNRTLAMVDPVFSTDDQRLVKEAAAKRRAQLDKISNERLMSIRNELGIAFSRLPLTSRLGESLKKADPTHTDLYEGMKAQKKVLFEKNLTPYKYCVFATHGYFGKDLPVIQEPVLVLTLPGQPEGQDGFLRMTEVMGLKMKCDAVALTACQTGLGRHVSGEGTMGMGRAFQYAGAKSVLMSLWSVAESSSVDLVTSFFKHLREGKNKLESLKLAREEIRKAGYDHPFFWAPFILVGEVN